MTHPKIKTPRLFEAVKNDIRKYMKRERRKELLSGSDFWDFACKFGPCEDEARTVHPAELDKCIEDAETLGEYTKLVTPISGTCVCCGSQAELLDALVMAEKYTGEPCPA